MTRRQKQTKVLIQLITVVTIPMLSMQILLWIMGQSGKSEGICAP